MMRQLPRYWFNQTGKTQRATNTVTAGSVATTYADNLTNLPMRLVAKGGSERVGSAIGHDVNNYTIYVNGNPAPDIIATDRVVFSARVFDIVQVNNPDESGAFLQLTCNEVMPSGVGA